MRSLNNTSSSPQCKADASDDRDEQASERERANGQRARARGQLSFRLRRRRRRRVCCSAPHPSVTHSPSSATFPLLTTAGRTNGLFARSLARSAPRSDTAPFGSDLPNSHCAPSAPTRLIFFNGFSPRLFQRPAPTVEPPLPSLSTAHNRHRHRGHSRRYNFVYNSSSPQLKPVVCVCV